MGTLLSAIGKFFSSAWRTLGEYLHIAIPEATAVLLNDLLKIADPIISDINNSSMTNNQKRDHAFSLISQEASKIALDVGSSLINSAIELSVLKLKATTPNTPVAPND